MKYTIARKLTASFGIVLFIMILSGIIVIIQLDKIKTNLNEIVNDSNPTSDAAYEMEINLIGTGFGLLGYLEDRDPEHLDRINEDISEFRQYHKIHNALSKTLKSKELSIQVHDQFDHFIQLAKRIIKIEDEQDQKIAKLYKNHIKMDDLLDNKIQMAVFANHPGGVTKLKAAMELEININGIAKGLGEYLRTHDSRYEARVMKDEGDFTHFFKQYKLSGLTHEETKWAKELNDIFKESTDLTEDIIEADKLIANNRYEFVKIRRKMDTILDEGIQEIALQELKNTSSGAAKSIVTTKNIAIILLVFGIIIGVCAAIYISREITKSIRKLSTTAKKITKGDLTARVQIQTQDEIGELADTFNIMAEELSLTKYELETQKSTLEKEIKQRTIDLEANKAILEKSVQDRTEQLQMSKTILEQKIAELEDFYDATVDRELKMEELQKRNKELESRL